VGWLIKHLKSFQRPSGQNEAPLNKNEQSAAADTWPFLLPEKFTNKNSMFVAPPKGLAG
jgi:hypothetical protein